MATPQIDKALEERLAGQKNKSIAPSAPTGELPAPALPRYGNRPMDIQQRHFDRARELKSQFENQYGPITTKDQDRQFQSFLQSQMGSFTDSASFATSVASGTPSTTGTTPGETVGHTGIYTPNDVDLEDWYRINFPNGDGRDYASPLPITPPGTPTPGTTPGTTGGADTINIDPSQSTLAPNFSSYVYNMLGKGEAAANLPYQEYTGQRFAGASPLQQQAFKGIGALGPSQGTQAGIGAAATALGGLQSLQPYQSAQINVPGVSAQQIGSTYQAPGAYTPASLTSPFQAPAAYQAGTFNAPGVTAQQVSSTYQAPSAYTGANIQSTFQAPTPYQAGTFQTGYAPGTFTSGYTPGSIETGLGALKSIQEYMSPYQQAVIDIQAREARRQADISRQGEQARLAQAGAYGGSRQAIMEAERQRNLGQQIGDIQERGLQSAYDRAMQQRMQEAGLGLQARQMEEQARQFGANIGLEAQRAGEQAKQFGVTSGLQAQQAQEASRQFAAQQGMTASQLQAQFDLDAAKANELSRQFGYQQQMTAAQLQSQFGLDAAKANQAAALQAAQATQQAAMDAQRMQEQSRQFASQQGMTAAQLQAQFGLDAAKANELSRQFGYQQQMTASQLQAQFGLDAAKANQMAALQAAQATQNATMEAQRLQEQSRQFGANLGLQGLQAQLSGAATLGTLGGQEFQQQLNTLQQQLTAGKEQQALEQQPLDFAYKQFQESMQYPYQQATYMQSLLQGLPLAARPYDSGQSGMAALLQGGLGGLALFEALKGKKGD